MGSIVMQLLPSPITVKVSAEEVKRKQLTWQNLERATRALHRDGLVVLEGAIEPEKLDKLNSLMVTDANVLQSLGDKMPFNFNKGNIQQDPPMTKAHFEPSIIINHLATQVTTSILGPRPRLSFISGNTALPPCPDSPPQSQPVHSDADFDHPLCPFAMVINVPLVDMNQLNGSTEVWLGSHIDASVQSQVGKHGDRFSGCIKDSLLEARRLVRPPSQPTVKKGSIVIRDLRLWHCGKPNFSKETRVMLAMIHFAPWYRNAMEVQVSEEIKDVLEKDGDGLVLQARYASDELVMQEYMKPVYGNEYDFNQVERLEDESF